MLNYRSFFLIAAIVVSVCGCMEYRLAVSLNDDGLPSFLTTAASSAAFNPAFFREIPGIGSDKFLNGTVVNKANTIEIYRTTFREKFFEKNNLLEYAEFNDSSKLATVDYLDIRGYSQDLYMLKYHFEWRTSLTSAQNIPQDGVIFFSVKKNRNDDVIGVLPCYFGTVNEDFNYIAFNTPLSFKHEKNTPAYLHLQKKNKQLPGLLFMPATFPDTASTLPKVLNIEKIVKLDPNKVGGIKPLVFYINDIFNDKSALQFHYVKTLQLTP